MKIKIRKQPSIFDEGHFLDMYTNLINKVSIDKLPNHQLTRIATILGKLSHETDLYNLLFEHPQQRLEIDNIQVNSKDLMAFVLMDHTFTRGWFANAAAHNATSDTTNSQGVPLALEGAKRLYKKSYMSWIPEHLSDMNEAWKLDVFLPAELGSIHLNDIDELELNKTVGLIRLFHNNIKFSSAIINQIRPLVPNWLSAHRPRIIDKNSIDEDYGDYYNKCSHKMRCMILQGWIWNPICRNESMICNIQDWDNFPSAIGFEGLVPQEKSHIPGLGRYI